MSISRDTLLAVIVSNGAWFVKRIRRRVTVLAVRVRIDIRGRRIMIRIGVTGRGRMKVRAKRVNSILSFFATMVMLVRGVWTVSTRVW